MKRTGTTIKIKEPPQEKKKKITLKSKPPPFPKQKEN